MKYLTIASSGVEDFICISDSPVSQTTNLLPDRSKCIRLITKTSSIEGFCPPAGQKIPKENFFVYNESSDLIEFYEARANTGCSIEYTKIPIDLPKGVAPPSTAKFRYFRALILYGWSMKNYSCCFWDTSVAPDRSRAGLAPFRYEVWYFEFDSIEDAYAWRNPKPYNLTPMRLAVEQQISSTTNYQRGVGYAVAMDYGILDSYLHGHYGLQSIDDENGTKTIFHAAGSVDTVQILSGNYTKVRMYEGDFCNYLYNQAYNSRGYKNIPLWPLRRQHTTTYNDYTDEEKSSIETFSNLYIAGIEYVLPDRYFRQNPTYTGGGGYWVYNYSLTPSLEKLDSDNTIGTDIMGFADLYISHYYGSGTYFRNADGVYFPSATSTCSFPSYSFTQNHIPRTLFYNPSGASLYATKNSISGYTTSPPDSKPPVMFPIIVTMRGDIGGDRVRHIAIKLGISIVYAVQYGPNEDIQNLPSFIFQDICPPNTIPNAQWILNL